MIVNIGLNNNAVQDIFQYFEDHRGYNVANFKYATSEYNGQDEETAVLELLTDYKLLSKVIGDFEKICAVMNQECIAISSDEFSLLVYNPNYTGKKMKFNGKYFIY
jgi:hypothetical protein